MRFLLLIIFLYYIYKSLKSWISPKEPSRENVSYYAERKEMDGNRQGEVNDVMLKDPYCEVYFPKRKGIQLKVKGEDLFFCSPECRNRFIESRSDQ